jgi:hypothetical protein
MWTVSARFTAFGYQTREVDLTVGLGIAIIALVTWALLSNTVVT